MRLGSGAIRVIAKQGGKSRQTFYAIEHLVLCRPSYYHAWITRTW